jgi:peptidoglycan/xylan/chitin deacetylase (PgdA/CDA1 family)
MLEALTNASVKATFVAIGSVASARRTDLAAAHANGHGIIAQSWSNTPLSDAALPAFLAEITTSINVVANATCMRPRLVRTPYGSITAAQLLVLQVNIVGRRLLRLRVCSHRYSLRLVWNRKRAQWTTVPRWGCCLARGRSWA